MFAKQFPIICFFFWGCIFPSLLCHFLWIVSNDLINGFNLYLKFAVPACYFKVIKSGSLDLLIEFDDVIVESAFAPSLTVRMWVTDLFFFYHWKIYKGWFYNFIAMRTSSNLNDLMMSLAGRTESKLGLTTTVKEQVDDIEVKVWVCRWRLITSRNLYSRSESSRASCRCSWKSCRRALRQSFRNCTKKSLRGSTISPMCSRAIAIVRTRSLSTWNCRIRPCMMSMISWMSSQMTSWAALRRQKTTLAFDHHHTHAYIVKISRIILQHAACWHWRLIVCLCLCHSLRTVLLFLFDLPLVATLEVYFCEVVRQGNDENEHENGYDDGVHSCIQAEPQQKVNSNVDEIFEGQVDLLTLFFWHFHDITEHCEHCLYDEQGSNHTCPLIGCSKNDSHQYSFCHVEASNRVENPSSNRIDCYQNYKEDRDTHTGVVKIRVEAVCALWVHQICTRPVEDGHAEEL